MTQMAENKQMVLNLKYIQEQDHKGYGAWTACCACSGIGGAT